MIWNDIIKISSYLKYLNGNRVIHRIYEHKDKNMGCMNTKINMGCMDTSINMGYLDTDIKFYWI